MRVLLTNDDGIFAEGIQVLSQKMQGIAEELYIVAPDHERSATGHAITMHRPLRAEPVKFLHNPHLQGWAVNGTPSDCVKLAVEALVPHKPDLVISGINRGPNLGTDILYSGTVSAAVEAVILGLPAIAVSLTEYTNPDFTCAANFIAKLAPLVYKEGIPTGSLLNINIPRGSREEIKGVKITSLGTRRYKNIFQKRVDPRGRSYYWMGGEIVEVDEGLNTDVAVVKRKFISITPIHIDLTNYKLMKILEKWDFDVQEILGVEKDG